MRFCTVAQDAPPPAFHGHRIATTRLSAALPPSHTSRPATTIQNKRNLFLAQCNRSQGSLRCRQPSQPVPDSQPDSLSFPQARLTRSGFPCLRNHSHKAFFTAKEFATPTKICTSQRSLQAHTHNSPHWPRLPTRRLLCGGASAARCAIHFQG